MNLIKKIREFLKDNQIDYLLVNSTNEFLVEYAPLNENSRYFLTNFSGSTGDAVISQEKIWLFADGRYHEQADLEVDKKVVTVVKMKIGESITNRLVEKLKQNKTFAIVSTKNSQGRLEILKNALDKKNIKIKLIDFDPILKETGKMKQEKAYTKIPDGITGLSSEEKIKKIAKTLKKDEAILVTNLEEVSYLLNLRDFSSNYTSSIKEKCFITKKGKHEFKDFDLSNIKKVFVDKTTTNVYDYAKLGEKAVGTDKSLIRDMKAIKTDAEIAHYKECFKRADKALLATREFINNNENVSEAHIAKNLEENFRKFGAKLLSFKSIVAKDTNAALAHYSKNSPDEILTEGSLVLIDCGAYYEGGYATDCTRVFVKGTPTKLQKNVYTCVLKAFLKAFNKKITPTTSGFSLDKAARKLLEEIKPSGFEFSHSLGHGIGISVHEFPPRLAFSPMAKMPLEINMCFTIEPGLYRKNFGGVRLENSCYLAKEGEKRIIKSFSNMCFEEKLIDYKLLSSTELKQLKSFKVCT